MTPRCLALADAPSPWLYSPRVQAVPRRHDEVGRDERAAAQVLELLIFVLVADQRLQRKRSGYVVSTSIEYYSTVQAVQGWRMYFIVRAVQARSTPWYKRTSTAGARRSTPEQPARGFPRCGVACVACQRLGTSADSDSARQTRPPPRPPVRGISQVAQHRATSTPTRHDATEAKSTVTGPGRSPRRRAFLVQPC